MNGSKRFAVFVLRLVALTGVGYVLLTLSVQVLVIFTLYTSPSGELAELFQGVDVDVIGFLAAGALFSLAIDALLLYAAYAVLFRFSPKAVKHILGVVFFVFFWKTLKLVIFPGGFYPISTSGPPSPWDLVPGLFMLCVITAAIVGHRFACRRLNAWLFPESGAPAPQAIPPAQSPDSIG